MKIEFKYLDLELKEAWESLVAANPAAGFMQSFFWADFKRKCGWKSYKIGLFTDDRLAGGAIIIKHPTSPRTNFLYIPEGPVLDYSSTESRTLFDALITEINKVADKGPKQVTTHIRIDPLLAPPAKLFTHFQKSAAEFQPADSLFLDLNLSEPDLLKQMKPKGRYNIKIAERSGVKIKEYSLDEGLIIFKKLYSQTVQRNSFEGLSENYFNNLIGTKSANKYLKIFVAEYREEPVAAAIVVFFGSRATYFFGASADAHKQVMAPYLLHWEIIKHAKENGFLTYDFWGISREPTDQKNPWYGITQFKLKFGGRPVHFAGAHDFIYQRELYHRTTGTV